MTDDVVLKINGKKYRGWEAFTLRKGIDAIASKMTVRLADKFFPENTTLPIYPGLHFDLELNGFTVIRQGHIDDVDPGHTDITHSITIEGREKSGVLVDASAVNKPGQFTNAKLDTVIREIVDPFGMKVVAGGDIGAAFKSFKLQPGEKAFDAINRACRQRGVLPITDGNKTITLTRPSTKLIASLELNKNIKAASSKNSHKNRYSEYIVQGQQQGNDFLEIDDMRAISGTAKDPSIKMFKPLFIIAGDSINQPDATLIAEWEATTRAARSEIVTIQVQGFSQPDGSLWELNRQCRVKHPFLFIDKTLLIQGLVFTQAEDTGSITEISLIRSDAFKPKPVVSTEDDILFDLTAAAGEDVVKDD